MATNPTAKSNAPVSPSKVNYKLGDKKYSPRCDHNDAAWQNVQTAITKGKGTASHTALCAALKQHTVKDGNHHDFIGYLVRRGSLARV